MHGKGDRATALGRGVSKSGHNESSSPVPVRASHFRRRFCKVGKADVLSLPHLPSHEPTVAMTAGR